MPKISPATEMKALVFVVLEHQGYVDGQRSDCVATDDLARHLGLENKEVMKVVSLLRKKSLVFLRFGALTPTDQSIGRVRRYLRVDKRSARRSASASASASASKTTSPYGIFGEKIIGHHPPVQGGSPGLCKSARHLRGFK